MSSETLRLLFALSVYGILGALIVGAFVWLHRHPEWWLQKYPEWIYGVDSGLRRNINRMGLLYVALAPVMLVAVVEPKSGDFWINAGFALSIPLAIGLSWLVDRPKRIAERIYDEGIEVMARIRERQDEVLRYPRFAGGSELAAHAAILMGAGLILRGQWSMEIEFEVDGRQVIDKQRVSSQAFYRFAQSHTLPILVRPEDPRSWIPVLGPTAERRH